MQDMEPHSEVPTRTRSNRAITALAAISVLSLLMATGAIVYAWDQKQQQVEAGQNTAEQVRRICEADSSFERENPGLCGNAKEVVKDDPEVQDKEIDDPDPNDPDPNDPDPFDDSDPDQPEVQQPERQDDEVQDDETQDSDPNDPDPVDDPDPNDPDPDDPDPNDPDPDDPDPGASPGSWTCPGNQYMVGFSREADGSITLICQPIDNGGGPPAAKQ